MAGSATPSARHRPSSTARFEARIPRELKENLERAAAVAGHPTVTGFVLSTLQDSARRVLEDHRQARLSDEDSRRFVDALLAPPEPNPELRTAWRRYRETRA
jgi:uncharacterized protein (DUF1778 family)